LAKNIKKYQPELLINADPDKKSRSLDKCAIFSSKDPAVLIEMFKKNACATTKLMYIAKVAMLQDRAVYEPLTRAMDGRPAILRATSEPLVDGFAKEPDKWVQQFAKLSGFVSQTDVLSEKMKFALEKMKLKDKKVWQIMNGVDTDRFVPMSERRKKQVRQDRFGWGPEIETVYVYSGRIGAKLKHVDQIINQYLAGGIENKSGLVFLGNFADTDYGNDLFTRFHGKHNIVFAGAVPHEELAEIVASSDVFVSASSSEGFSNSTLEAQACGLPVIAREGVSGNDLMVIDNQTGFMFKDEAEMGKQMVAMQCMSLRERLGQNSRQHVVSNYGIEFMVNQYETVFADVIKGRSAS